MDVYLETERMMLRRLTPADVDALVELDGDPAVLRWINGGRATPRQAMQARILPRMLSLYESTPGYGYWAAIEKASGEFLGWFSLHPDQDRDPDNIALGYRLRRSCWGKGYATEGARALIRKGFEELGMRRVFAITYEQNIGSRRVMEKVGMQLVRTFRMSSEELSAAPTWEPECDTVWDGDDVEYALELCDWQKLQ